MDDQTAVLEFLGEGASYGRPGVPVERIDTHASALFLIGDRVYKLKRAIAFSYLDYSTVALREQACRAELALNRRTAPMLYLAVRAITRGADGRLGFDGGGETLAGETLDWVVEMRRFDAAGLFDRLAEERRLTPRLMRDTADVIAAFHAAVEPASSTSGGTAAVITGIEDELNRAGGAFAAAAPGLTREWRAALARLAPLLAQRQRDGKVRRCHGDLHLGNICLTDGRPTLFDAVEFSDAIAVIDVLYDLAFLLMDLVHRELTPLTAVVLNRYFDRGEDAAGLAVLPLFLSLRAAIRAHVSASAAEHQADGEAASHLRITAQRYLALAQVLLRPAAPCLIAIGGLSGTGKSTLAQALAADFLPAPGARVLRSDVLRKALGGVAPETRLPADAYTPAANERVYSRLFSEASAGLAAGASVILDAVFLAPKERAAAAEIAAAAGTPFIGFWLDAAPSVLAARLDARRDDASDADRAVAERQLALDPGPLSWRRIAAGGDAQHTLAAVRQIIARG